jgi:pimeloyl-ACP methyl ester carboxylesterase
MSLEVTEVGHGERLVLFVHGALGSGRSFDRVASLLDEEATMLLYDRRGYGTNAAAATDGPVGVDQHIADAIELLDGRRAVVIGHSFGGVTALGVGARAPELVDAIGLYETSLAWSPGWDDTVMSGILASDDPVDSGLILMLGERYAQMDAAERSRRRIDGAAFAAEERSIRLGPPLYDVSAVTAPVVLGRSDDSVMPSVVDFLARELPELELRELPGSGHHAHRSDPEGFAALVRRALELARRREATS